jgi:hypothetical protein
LYEGAIKYALEYEEKFQKLESLFRDIWESSWEKWASPEAQRAGMNQYVRNLYSSHDLEDDESLIVSKFFKKD